MREMKLQDLKSKSPTELLAFAEEHQVENASTMRKQEQMFAILKQLAAKEIDPDDAVTYAADRRPFQRFVTDTTLMPKLEVTGPTPQATGSGG